MAAESETATKEEQMLAVRIDKGLHGRLKALSERERRSMGSQLEIALEEHFDRMERAGKA